MRLPAKTLLTILMAFLPVSSGLELRPTRMRIMHAPQRTLAADPKMLLPLRPRTALALAAVGAVGGIVRYAVDRVRNSQGQGPTTAGADNISEFRAIPVAAPNSLQSQYRASAVKIVPWEAADITVGAEQEPEPIAVATSSTEVKDTQITEGLIITGTILALPLLIKAFFVNKLGAALLLGA